MSANVVGTRVGSKVGARRDSNPDPNFPETAAHVLLLTGITPSSLYLCRETSGNLADSVGAANLTAIGTPVFQYQTDQRNGVWYDGAADAHNANVNDLAAASGLYAAAFRIVNAPGVGPQGIIGRTNATAQGVFLYTTDSVNYPQALFKDATPNTLGIQDVNVDIRNRTDIMLGVIQVDRTAAIGRARISRWGGLLTEFSGSIAGFATFTAGGQTFGFGAGAGAVLIGGAAVAWAMVATGAQCEGAGVPQAIARGLGWES